MADETRIIERNTNTTKPEGNNGITFIVGGLVVAVGVLVWLVLGGGVPFSTGSGGSTTNTSVTVEAPEPSPAPAPEPAAPAVADPAPKP